MRRALTLLLAGLLMTASAQALRLVTTHFPPFAMERGADAPGPLVSQVLAAMSQAGHPGPVEFVPWPRAQLLATTGEEPVLILPLVRSPEREASYQWVGVLACRYMGFVSLRQRLSRFDDEALAGARLAVLRAAPYRSPSRVGSLQQANSFEDMARLLQQEMVDVLYGNQDTIVLNLQARGVDRAALALSRPLEADALWLAASLNTPAATLEALREALRNTRKDPALERQFARAGLSRPAAATVRTLSADSLCKLPAAPSD
ncbi:hypothetical protein [Pelomonas sp. KK5]|uniref:hypothetical protein n=1 Tax=Pelomonas sp. KK5 TaxID=1855730 RepID=UPI00097C5DDC|nr:hypothetical protein [Pelomonas sp. KK5]